jgi:hypothetical protein
VADSAPSDAPGAGWQPSALRAFARHLRRSFAIRIRSPRRGALQPIGKGRAAEAPPLLTGPAFPSACDADLTTLVYELLDAHADTAQLVDVPLCDAQWQAHIDYLRALQRKGRETLARVGPL